MSEMLRPVAHGMPRNPGTLDAVQVQGSDNTAYHYLHLPCLRIRITEQLVAGQLAWS